MDPKIVVDKKFIPNVILKYKIKELLKFWRKRAKNTKQRWYKLKQWSSTEQSYLQKLIILRDQIKKPLVQSNMISEIQQALMFPNLDSMIQLAVQMKNKIDSLITTWHPRKTLLAPTVESLVIYLKIYKQYSNNYSKADKIMIELKKRPQFDNIIKIPVVQDYTFKPIQRPLQYKLFLADYIKLLPPTHQDKPHLQKALTVLLKIADQINQFVEKQSRAQKMIALQNLYGNIIQSARQYRSYFQAIHTDFNVKVHVFNDLLLIVKIMSQFKDEKYMYMNLCGGSYVIRQPNNKNFKDRLYICGTYESIHLTFKCPQDANNAFNLVQKIIQELHQKQYNRSQLIAKVKRQTMYMNRHSMGNEKNYKWKQQSQYKLRLRVQVVGVQKRLYEKQWKIVYAVKIQLAQPQKIYQIVYYEIDELKQVQRYLKQVYPSLSVPSLDTRLKGMNYQDAKVDFTKYFQYKCILIEDFLNFCLRCKQLSKKIQFLIYKLKLSQALWDFLNRFSQECSCPGCQTLQVFNIQGYKKQQLRIRKKQFQFCILHAFFCQKSLPEMIKPEDFKLFSLDEKITWATCKQNRIQYGVLNRGHFGRKIQFHVSLLLVGQESQIYIEDATVSDTCRQIVQEVCKRKGITQCNDFCLYYVHGKHQFYLDNDQYVYEAIKHLQQNYKKLQVDKKQSINRISIFNSFSRNMDDFGQTLNDFSIPDQPKLFLRKYIYLGNQLEIRACKKNHERYPIIIGQLLRRFQQQILLLSIEQLRLFCALFYGVQQFNTIIFSKNIFCNQEKLKRLMPESKWSFVSLQFTEKIRQILENQVKPCRHILLLYQTILIQFGDKLGSYTQYFLAQSVDSGTIGVKDKKLLIGVNMNKVTVGRLFNSVSLLEFPLLKLQYAISGDCLSLNTQDKSYKFVGNGWNLFQQLVQKYKLILQMEMSLKM